MKDPGHLSNSQSGSHQGRSTSTTLIERVKQRDGESWKTLVKLYRPLVLYWCKGRLKHTEDKEEILQEVFLTIHSKVGTFVKEDRAYSFRKWLREITFNKLRDLYKRTRGRPVATGGTDAQELLENAPFPPADVEESEEQEATEQHILCASALAVLQNQKEISEQGRVLVLRTSMNEEPVEVVAKDLKMTKSAAYTAKSRALSKLRTLLDGSGAD